MSVLENTRGSREHNFLLRLQDSRLGNVFGSFKSARAHGTLSKADILSSGENDRNKKSGSPFFILTPTTDDGLLQKSYVYGRPLPRKSPRGNYPAQIASQDLTYYHFGLLRVIFQHVGTAAPSFQWDPVRRRLPNDRSDSGFRSPETHFFHKMQPFVVNCSFGRCSADDTEGKKDYEEEIRHRRKLTDTPLLFYLLSKQTFSKLYFYTFTIFIVASQRVFQSDRGSVLIHIYVRSF